MTAAAVTEGDVLVALRSAQCESLDSLVPLVYRELRTIAHRHLAKCVRPEAGDQTLATTAVVNEVYLKLANQSDASWQNRTHFLALASVAMRHILIDRAKAHAARKRGRGCVAVSLDPTALAADEAPETLLEVNDALDWLAQLDPRLGRVAEYRFFGGLSDDEIADVLGVTARTVQRDWAKARMLLRRALAE